MRKVPSCLLPSRVVAVLGVAAIDELGKETLPLQDSVGQAYKIIKKQTNKQKKTTKTNKNKTKKHVVSLRL